MSRLTEYFLEEPMRLFYLIGGTGGIWYWFNQWRDRTRIKVKIIKEKPFLSEDMDECSTMVCEIENLGSRPTSLRADVSLTGYTPKGEFGRYQGSIATLERDLQPHKPKEVIVDFKAENLVFLLFRKYTFRLTRGSSKTLRVWSASQQSCGPFKFLVRKLSFKYLGQYNEPGT